MRILFDAGIFIHSEIAEAVTLETPVQSGPFKQVRKIAGFRRKPMGNDASFQQHTDALFTIGRLIREGAFQAYTYNEVRAETWRRGRQNGCNALADCKIDRLPPAIERSRLQSLTFREVITKGGRKDRRAGVDVGIGSQIAFFTWLISLKASEVQVLLDHCDQIRLTPFEQESLQQLDWFKFMCARSGSPENYPDIFHLWTAERNRCDAMLTLDGRLQNTVRGVRGERRKTVDINCEVFRPGDLLQRLEVVSPDPVPMAPDRFYHWHEMPGQ